MGFNLLPPSERRPRHWTDGPKRALAGVAFLAMLTIVSFAVAHGVRLMVSGE